MSEGQYGLTTPEQREALTKAERKGRKVVEKHANALESLVIEWVTPEQIKPNPWNPNRQSHHDFELLLRSMEEDGFTQPVVCVRVSAADLEVDKIRDAGYLNEGDLMIVDGEHRWRAGSKLGFDKIPIVVTPMTAAQAMIATLRHNRARGSEDIELAANVLRDLESLGSLAWAQDSLMMDDIEVQRLLDDVAAPEALADENHGGAWEPDQSVDPEGEPLQVEAQTVAAPSGEWTKAATPAAVEAARNREDQMKAATNDEQRRMIQRDTSKEFHRVSLVFAGDEGKLVKDVLGGAPAETLIALCRERAGEEMKLKDDGWVAIDTVIGGRMIPAAAATILASAIETAREHGDVTEKNAWQLIEYLAADYSAGK